MTAVSLCIPQSSPQLPVFTFPADGCTSFSEYLGGPATGGTSAPVPPPPAPVPHPPVSDPPTDAVDTSSAVTSAFSAVDPPPPPPPPTAVPATEPSPLGAEPAAAEPHPAVGGAEEPTVSAAEDSPPGASMASSFTFAGSQLSGPGSQGSAASSRHSDWEYVGGRPEGAAGQEAADKLQVRALLHAGHCMPYRRTRKLSRQRLCAAIPIIKHILGSTDP